MNEPDADADPDAHSDSDSDPDARRERLDGRQRRDGRRQQRPPARSPATPRSAASAAPTSATCPAASSSDASCQQLAGNSKYRRVKAKGIGTIRVRAYATGPATKVSPVLVTTQISGGKAKKVTYKLDGKKLKAKRGKTWKAAITPQKLTEGRHPHRSRRRSRARRRSRRPRS